MPTQLPGLNQDTPQKRKYRKKFNSDILCAALWGVNLLIGTENSLMHLDRSGQSINKENRPSTPLIKSKKNIFF